MTTDNDQRFANLAMKAANERTHQMIEIAALKRAARAVVARGGHAYLCLISDFGGCTCGWENALADLAALVEREDA